MSPESVVTRRVIFPPVQIVRQTSGTDHAFPVDATLGKPWSVPNSRSEAAYMALSTVVVEPRLRQGPADAGG